MSTVPPIVGETLLGTYRIESSEELPGGLSLGAAAADGTEVSWVALPLGAPVSRDPAPLLGDQDRYRIGAPGIAKPLGVAIEGNVLRVVYERRHSECLADWLQQPPRPRPSIAHAITAIASALAPLHDQGIAFGALRPELLRIGPEGVSIEGFALDAILRALVGDRASVATTPLAYRAPEQQSSTPGPPTPAADVYALGVLATELVIGRALGPADERPTPRACGTDVSDAVEAAISRAVARSPVARPHDLIGFAQGLAEALLVPHYSPQGMPPASAPSASEASPPWAAGAPAPLVAPPAPAAPAPIPGAEGPSPNAAAAAPRPPAPPPRMDSMPPSGRGARGNAGWIVALLAGVGLMLAGVGGLFAYAMLRTPPTPVSTAATGTDAGVVPSIPSPRAPTVPGPTDDPDPEEPAEDAGAASAEPDSSAPLPSNGVRVVSGADLGSPLPLPADVPVWGSEKALVTIVVFGDLECPHTRRAQRALESLLRAFPNDVRLAFRHRPLAIHTRARDAARVAAGVRRDLGDTAFWRLMGQAAASSLDANRVELGKWVTSAGGQESQVETWLSQTDTDNEVGRDLQLAGLFDVRETPTFFVNGVRVEGFSSYDDLKRVVEKELTSARSVLTLGTALSELYATRVRKNLIGLGADVAARTCPPVAGSPERGATDALVTIVEFSEFQCPFCRRVQPTLDTLLAKHGGDLRVVWKNFPLDHHTQARPAAAFALEAFELGGPTKFWKAHDLLFASQADLTEPALEGLAQKLGLDATKLLEASRRRGHDPKIDGDARLGQKLGVSGTPAFFVNGRSLTGAQPIERFEAVIREELESARHLVGSGTPRGRIYDALCGVR